MNMLLNVKFVVQYSYTGCEYQYAFFGVNYLITINSCE